MDFECNLIEKNYLKEKQYLRTLKIITSFSINPYTQIETYSPEKFANDHGFSWKRSKHSLDNEDKILQQVALYMDPHGAGYLVICIDPQGIPDKTILGEYTGDILTGDINIAFTHDFYILYNPYNTEKKFISSKNFGNIVRFTCDLPTPEALCLKYNFQENQDKIATSNCKLIKHTDQQDHIALFLQTTRKIQYGEIIGWSYGDTYWNNLRFQSVGKVYKFLFNKYSGNVIKSSLKKYMFFGSAEHCYIKKFSLLKGRYWKVQRKYNNLKTNDGAIMSEVFAEIPTDKLIKKLSNKQGLYIINTDNKVKYYLPFYEVIYLLIKYYNKNEHCAEIQSIIDTHYNQCLARKKYYNNRALLCIFLLIITKLISDYFTV